MADGIDEWMPVIAYLLLVLPMLGMAFGEIELYAPITVGVVIGIVGLLRHFKVWK